MVSSPITSCKIKGEKVEAVTDLIFLGSKIPAGGGCSHEIKRLLLLERKAMTNLRQHIKNQRHHFADKGLYIQSYGFSSSHIQMWRRLSTEELMLSNFGIVEYSWESLGLQGAQKRKSTLNIHWKDWCWSWSSNTLAIWCEELTNWKRPWCWERLKAKEEERIREWDG